MLKKELVTVPVRIKAQMSCMIPKSEAFQVVDSLKNEYGYSLFTANNNNYLVYGNAVLSLFTLTIEVKY